jgi:hypothetical protein
MSKGYKKEWIEKVKQKFNDVQPNNNKDNRPANKQSDNKIGKVCNSNGVDRIR